jgi:hypothetical protein
VPDRVIFNRAEYVETVLFIKTPGLKIEGVVDLTPESELGLDNFFVILRVWFSGEGGRRLRLGGRRLFVPRRSQPVQIKVDDRRGV